MADDGQIGQDEIEKLLQQAQDTDAPEGDPPEAAPPAASKPEADDSALDQSEIEALMGGGAKATATAPETPSAPKPSAPSLSAAAPSLSAAAPSLSAAAPSPPAAATGEVAQSDVELLLNQAQAALASIDNGPAEALPDGAQAFEFKDFVGTPASTDSATLQLMQDVELDLKIELGRTHMHLEEALRLKKGAVVTLDKLAGDPVDIYVNGRLIARGEVLVLNDNFCVRVAELIVGESACA